MSFKLGYNGKLYYAVGGQSGSWVELDAARDVKLTMECDEADATARKNGGWKAVVPTLSSATVETDLVWDPDDAGFAALRTAFLTRATIGMKVLDAASGQGLQADFMVTNFSRSEPLADVETVNVTAKVTYSDTPPSWTGAD